MRSHAGLSGYPADQAAREDALTYLRRLVETALPDALGEVHRGVELAYPGRGVGYVRWLLDRVAGQLDLLEAPRVP